MDCTVFFIASFLVPITLGLPSFIVDSRKASIYLVFNLSLITITYLLATILFIHIEYRIFTVQNRVQSSTIHANLLIKGQEYFPFSSRC